jgi:uncharacterized YccA/Bax inhibitor family protein
MALSNPALNQQKFQAAIDEEQSGQSGWAAPASSAPAADGTALRPPSGIVTGKVMTYGGTFSATSVLFVLLLGGGWFGWQGVTQTSGVTNAAGQTTYSVTAPGWLFIVAIAALGVAIVTIFKPRIAMFTGPIYAILEGAVLGAISAMYNAQFKGIVLQAVLATLSVFAVMLFLYATRLVRVTKRFRMIIVGAMLGIMVMYLLSFVASLFGATVPFLDQPTPMGIGISVLIVGVASFNLMLNFDLIESGVVAKAPRYMEWYGAFGLMIALVWLYLEILRLLSLLKRR